MNTTLYIQTNKNVEVNRAKVRLSDMAHVVCEDKETENRCKELCVIDLSNKKPGSYVITALDLVRAVKSMDNDIEVTHDSGLQSQSKTAGHLGVGQNHICLFDRLFWRRIFYHDF